MTNQLFAIATLVALSWTAAPHRGHPPSEHAPVRHGPTAGQGRAAALHGLIRAKAGKVAKAKAAAAKAAPADEVEQIEAVEPVETVENVDSVQPSSADGTRDTSAAANADGPKPKMNTNVWLGHMHAAVVHLPIAWLLLWSAFEALGLLWAHPWLIMAGLPMGVVTSLSFAPAVYTGLMRLDELALASPNYDVSAAHLHRNLLFLGWALVVLACGMRLTNARPGRSFIARTAYIALVWLALAVTGWSAHLGGCMVYGDDFFGL